MSSVNKDNSSDIKNPYASGDFGFLEKAFDEVEKQKGGKKPTEQEVMDYVRSQQGEKAVEELESTSVNQVGALLRSKESEFNRQENETIKEFLEKSSLADLDDSDRLATQYQSKTRFKTDANVDYFKKKLDEKSKEVFAEQKKEFEQYAGKIDDKTMVSGMLEAFTNTSELAARHEHIHGKDGIESKAEVYAPLIDQNTQLEERMAERLKGFPDLLEKFEKAKESYEENKGVYDENFVSPKKYAQSLADISDELVTMEEKVEEAKDVIAGKTFSNVPDLPKKALNYDQFRDELKKAKLYDLSRDMLDNPGVRDAIQAKNKELYEEWSQARQGFLDTKKQKQLDDKNRLTARIHSMPLPDRIDGSEKFTREEFEQEMREQWEQLDVPAEFRDEIESVWSAKIDRLYDEYMLRRTSYNEGRHKTLTQQIHKIGLPGELDGSEKLSREDLAKKLQPELDKLEMSDGTKKHMQHVWDGHLDRLYAEYGKLREAHEQEAHSAQIFSGDLAKMDASGIPFDTKLSFGDFQKAMEKEHPVTPESDEQLKEKNEHIYGLYDAWTKQRNQLITQTSKAINKAQLPSQLPDGLDKKQFARELGDDLFGISKEAASIQEVEQLRSTRENQLFTLYESQQKEATLTTESETAAPASILGKIDAFGKTLANKEIPHETFADFEKAFLIAQPSLVTTYRSSPENQEALANYWETLEARKQQQEEEQQLEHEKQMAEISDGIATFGASHDMKEFADYPSYEKAFLLLHPQHREMVTQQDEFRELLKQEFEQPRSEQADSLSHLERQAGDIDWDELGVGKAYQNQTQNRWRLLQQDSKVARHIDLVTRDFPEVEDFILQSLSTLENETDFRQMQLALRDLEVKSSSKQETLEWLESFCGLTDLGRLKQRMPDTFTTFRQYCTTRFQWNLNDALGQQQDEASVEDPQDVIPDDEHQDIFEPDTDVGEKDEIQELVEGTENTQDGVQEAGIRGSTDSPGRSQESELSESEEDPEASDDTETTETTQTTEATDTEEEQDSIVDESDEELDGDGVEGLDDDSHDVLAGEDEKSLESTEEVSDELEIESDVQDDVDEVESEDELEEDSEVSGDETTQTTEATDVRESEDFASDSLEGPESELGEAREEMSDDVEIFEHPDVASVTLSVRSHEFFETADFLLDIDEMQMDEFLVDLTEGVLDASEESTDEETETAGGIQEGIDMQTLSDEVEALDGEQGVVNNEPGIMNSENLEQDEIEDSKENKEGEEDSSVDQEALSGLDQKSADEELETGDSEEHEKGEIQDKTEEVLDLVEEEHEKAESEQEEEKKKIEEQKRADELFEQEESIQEEAKEEKERISVRERERYELKMSVEVLIKNLLRESHNPASFYKIIMKVRLLSMRSKNANTLEDVLRMIDPQLFERLRAHLRGFYTSGQTGVHGFSRLYREAYVPSNFTTIWELLQSIQKYAWHTERCKISIQSSDVVGKKKISKDAADRLFDQVVSDVHQLHTHDGVTLTAHASKVTLTHDVTTLSYDLVGRFSEPV